MCICALRARVACLLEARVMRVLELNARMNDGTVAAHCIIRHDARSEKIAVSRASSVAFFTVHRFRQVKAKSVGRYFSRSAAEWRGDCRRGKLNRARTISTNLCREAEDSRRCFLTGKKKKIKNRSHLTKNAGEMEDLVFFALQGKLINIAVVRNHFDAMFVVIVRAESKTGRVSYLSLAG